VPKRVGSARAQAAPLGLLGSEPAQKAR